MKNLSLLTLLFVLLVASPTLSNGQQFGNNGSTANVNNPVRNTEPLTVDLLEKNFPAVNISSWEGEQFVFAPASKRFERIRLYSSISEIRRKR